MSACDVRLPRHFTRATFLLVHKYCSLHGGLCARYSHWPSACLWLLPLPLSSSSPPCRWLVTDGAVNYSGWAGIRYERGMSERRVHTHIATQMIVSLYARQLHVLVPLLPISTCRLCYQSIQFPVCVFLFFFFTYLFLQMQALECSYLKVGKKKQALHLFRPLTAWWTSIHLLWSWWCLSAWLGFEPAIVLSTNTLYWCRQVDGFDVFCQSKQFDKVLKCNKKKKIQNQEGDSANRKWKSSCFEVFLGQFFPKIAHLSFIPPCTFWKAA